METEHEKINRTSWTKMEGEINKVVQNLKKHRIEKEKNWIKRETAVSKWLLRQEA